MHAQSLLLRLMFVVNIPFNATFFAKGYKLRRQIFIPAVSRNTLLQTLITEDTGFFYYRGGIFLVIFFKFKIIS